MNLKINHTPMPIGFMRVGGMGTFELLRRMKGNLLLHLLFVAKIILITENIKGSALGFHGTKVDVVPSEHSKTL